MINLNLALLKTLLEGAGITFEVKELDLWAELENYVDPTPPEGWKQLAMGVTEEGKTVVVHIRD